MSNTGEVQLKLYEPTRPQVEMAELIDVDKPFISLFAFGRQVGKSHFGRFDAFTKGINGERPNGSYGKTEIYWISPTADQAVDNLKAIMEKFEGREELQNRLIKRVDRKYPEITFHNNSYIKFRSAEQGDSLRGGTKHWIYVDEAAFVDKNFIDEVLTPMTVRTEGRLVFLSTFNGRNWYWDLYLEGQKEERSHYVKSLLRTFIDLDDPKVTKTCLLAKEGMSLARYNQEYLCMPVSADSVFSNIPEAITKDLSIDPDKDHFAGADIGLIADETVLTLQDQDGRVVDIERINYRESGMSHDEFKQIFIDFVERHKEYTVAGFFETNGKELLYDELCDISNDFARIFDPIKVHHGNKGQIVEGLVVGFEKNIVKIPKDKDVESQLYDFRGKQDSNGNWKFGNSTKSGHDDIVMSMAHANYARIKWYEGGSVETW